MGKCPEHTRECPASARVSCCAIGLRCASDLYIEYQYTALALLQPLPAKNNTPFTSQGFYGCVIPAILGAMRIESPSCNPSTDGTLPTCASQNCQPENASQQGHDLPTSDTILGKPTAWGAKIGEIAVQSQAEENWDGKNKKRRLRRLGRVVVGLLVVTVVMFVF